MDRNDTGDTMADHDMVGRSQYDSGTVRRLKVPHDFKHYQAQGNESRKRVALIFTIGLVLIAFGAVATAAAVFPLTFNQLGYRNGESFSPFPVLILRFFER